jgi:protein-L-isoaspartate(D-aspartate) O-methyltransferase
MKAPARKSWMVEIPKTPTAKPSRPGKPITATAAVAKKKGTISPVAARVAPSEPRAKAEFDRRERTQGSGHARATLNPDRQRERMVERLAASGIRHPAVLAAMGATPRHRFVDEGLASRAYDDTALPIGHAQTISQPYVVARMTELILSELPVAPHLARVMEIGTGCGYQAAVLAQVVGEVYSIERIRALHDRARDNLRALRVPNLRLVHGDGLCGLPDAAPFDAMLIAAAGDALPDALLDQIKVGGRALAPLAMGRGRSGEQTLCLFVRTARSGWSTTLLDAVRFVPLVAGLA